MADQRLAVGAGSPTISATFRAASGSPATAGTVTVGVVDWDGTTVLAAGTATTESSGVYTVALPASAVASVTQLTATWTATGRVVTTKVDVVGSRLVWPDEFTSAPGLSYSSYSAQQVSDAIAWFEDLAYRHCGWSPIERFRQATVRAGWGSYFMLPDHYVLDLIGVTWQAAGVADVVATAPELALFEVGGAGEVIGAYSTQKALVAYTHGNPDGARDLHDAALDAVRIHLQESSAGRPAISINDGLSVTRFSTAGPGRPTGIPEVDEVLNANRIPVCA